MAADFEIYDRPAGIYRGDATLLTVGPDAGRDVLEFSESAIRSCFGRRTGNVPGDNIDVGLRYTCGQKNLYTTQPAQPVFQDVARLGPDNTM